MTKITNLHTGEVTCLCFFHRFFHRKKICYIGALLVNWYKLPLHRQFTDRWLEP